MCFSGANFWSPEERYLIEFGAKYSRGLLQGEYFRIFTPIFVHVGFLHFLINNVALFMIGRQIELNIGPWLYLLSYLVTGICGSLLSALLTNGNSAGASGAIFGLVGIGFVFERAYARRLFAQTGQRLRKGPFTGLVIVNVLLGFILTSGPIRIDNAAHMGGLISGILIGFSYLIARRGILAARWTTLFNAVFFTVIMIVGAMAATSESFYRFRIETTLNYLRSKQSQFEVLTEALNTLPTDDRYRFKRGALLTLDGQLSVADEDFAQISDKSLFRDEAQRLVNDLRAKSMSGEATYIGRLFSL
jgi:membrane associated rhomboid family serine protease